MTARSFYIKNALQEFGSILSNYRARIANWFRSILVTVCVALGIAGCAQSNGGPSGSGTSAQLKIVSATDLGTVPTNPAISGRDGGYSAAFQGVSVWAYSDTFLTKPDASGRTLLSNTWSYTNSLDALQGITGFQERLDTVGSPTMLIQETPDELSFNLAHYGDNCQVRPCGQRWAIWPAAIVTDPASTHALVFYSVQSVDPNGNFHGVGSSVALWEDFNQLPQRPTFNPPFVTEHSDLMFNQNEPNFGSAGFTSNGVLYVYGCGLDTDGLDKGCRLAKVDPATVQDRATWMFYVGSGRWSATVKDAVPVFNGLDILSVSWNSYLQQYVAVYSALFSQNVMMRTSPNPEGPWSDEIKAFTAMAPVQGNVVDAHAHSEYDSNGGQTIYVTYSRATGAFSSEVRLVAVQLQAGIGQAQ